VTVPYKLGLEGHSDADVVVHALCDAMLGALALGDLGQHFPSSDDRWRGVSSLVLLQRVTELLRDRHYILGNADITIVAQQPRLAPYIARMVQAVAAAVGGEPGRISIKATTTDGLGFIGQGAGIAAYAICLVHPDHLPSCP
jgi:2-C-methyl-D-erythritol 2,4-cyclodiphosphate synthase